MLVISGLGISKIKNLATLTNKNIPVSINTVNGGNPLHPECNSSNPSFYQRNDTLSIIQYDGFTKVLEINYPVIIGRSYHLKLAIADVSDNILDSGVLIEGNSIISFFFHTTYYFNKDSYILDYDEKTKLDQLIIELSTLNKPYKLLVTGHTDSDADVQYNDLLSKKKS